LHGYRRNHWPARFPSGTAAPTYKVDLFFCQFIGYHFGLFEHGFRGEQLHIRRIAILNGALISSTVIIRQSSMPSLGEISVKSSCLHSLDSLISLPSPNFQQ